MATKLKEITTQYRTFVKDQVLTKDQLNEFISYFEDQDRMSRVFLHGVGVVCGLILKDITKKSITITQGVGVTTDGDLITLRRPASGNILQTVDLNELVFTHYKPFEDKFASYPAFQYIKKEGKKTTIKSMDLVELLTNETENAKPLESLDDKILGSKTVLLYLESYAKMGDLCTTIDCDSQGVEQIARLRILLVSNEDAKYIAENDSIFSKHDLGKKISELPKLAVRRVVLNQSNSKDYDKLRQAYYSAIIRDNLVENLIDGIKKLMSNFGGVLKLEPLKESFENFPEILKKIIGAASNNNPLDFQYRYDFLKDMVDTWSEIRDLLFSLNEVCFPDIKAFPKHLLLGQINGVNINPIQNRHQFYKSTSITQGVNKTTQCKGLIERLLSMVEHYNVPSGEVKITPSSKLIELSKRSIPFYYKINGKFLKLWDYKKTEKYIHTENLSYHSDKFSDSDQIIEPLSFDIDRFDFFRIEGHQGKSYRTVLKNILDIKQRFGLSFEVKTLSLNVNTDNLNIKDYEAEFEDLNVLLRAWRAEQECVLAEVSSYLSGLNLIEPENKEEESRNETPLIKNAKDKKKVFTQRKRAEKEETVIIGNLTEKKDSLGELLIDAYSTDKVKTPNDLIVDAKDQLYVRYQEAWKGKENLNKMLIDNSIELIAWSNDLVVNMPYTLVELNPDHVATYNLSLDEVCKRVERMKIEYHSSKLKQNEKNNLTILINQLSGVCCSGGKLEVLMEEIEKRKESILKRLQLSEFLKEHPGLEHKAGVDPGGTFILVYLNKRISNKQEKKGDNLFELLTDFKVEELKDLTPRERKEQIDRIEEYFQEFKRDDERADQSLAFKLQRRFDEERQREDQEYDGKRRRRNEMIVETDISEDIVIADFSLPYICCSNSRSVNFMIQKEHAWLRLEKDKICLDEDAEIKLMVSPEGGEILSDPEVKGLTIIDDKLKIDLKSFPKESFEKSIAFTVNGQETEATLIVFKPLQVDFKVPESPTSETEFTFEPTGDIKNAAFSWDFGDGSPISDKEKPNHVYQFPVNEENKVVIKLTVTASNGVCKTTVEKEIEFKEVEVTVDLDGRDFCEGDSEKIYFTIESANPDVNIEGKGVEKDSDGFFFLPKEAGVGEHTFNVNGEQIDLKVTVHETPVAKINAKQEGNKLVVYNQSTGASSFVWKINNGESEERNDTSPFVRELNPNSPTKWNIVLEAKSEFCGVDKSSIRIDTKLVRNCIDETTNQIGEDFTIVEDLRIGNRRNVILRISTIKLYENIISDTESFLSGGKNGDLQSLFVELLQETSNVIIEMPRTGEYTLLLHLFELQLMLLYNILRCQNNEVIMKYEKTLFEQLDLIINVFYKFKESDIKLSSHLHDFIEVWTNKVPEGTFKKHGEKILNEELI